jgi:hypothetical protein
MKKKALLALLACVVATGVLFTGTAPAHAAGMSVGASTWYWKWNISPEAYRSFEPGLMYGPVLGFDWGKNWSLTSVFLTGTFRMENEMIPWNGYPRRYDSDTTLNYSVLRWLKVFGGFKYMRYDAIAGEDGKTTGIFEGTDMRHYSYGPGLGVGITVPVTGSLFALANISGMYLSGHENFDDVPGNMYNKDITETGFNSTVSLAYYAASIATTFALGVRYQYFVTEYDSPYLAAVGQPKKDHSSFYGITFSAVYHFGLGSEE